jgi:hypothetical protein
MHDEHDVVDGKLDQEEEKTDHEGTHSYRDGFFPL